MQHTAEEREQQYASAHAHTSSSYFKSTLFPPAAANKQHDSGQWGVCAGVVCWHLSFGGGGGVFHVCTLLLLLLLVLCVFVFFRR